MVAVPVNFLENRDNVVYLGEKVYLVLFRAEIPGFFKEPPHIIVSGKKYPLEYNGYRLCDDLRYRKSLQDSLPFSGPHSAFTPTRCVPEEGPREATRNHSM